MKTSFKSLSGCFFLFFSIALFSLACKNGIVRKKDKPSLKVLVGQTFYEIRREFESGFCFNRYGFEQKPEWIMHFIEEDSVEIYSPFEKKFLQYNMYCDHDSVFNVAREWVRLKAISKDSIVFQLLEVEGRRISKDRSNVYMKFYSASYLKSIHTAPEILRQPLKKDTLFVQQLADIANRNPANVDSAFGATKPVEFKSQSKRISISSRESKSLGDIDRSKAYDYLYPEFDIALANAYKDFNYTFTVLVGDKGIMRLGQFVASDEFKESRRRVLDGIIKVYLQNLLEVQPGRTLGIPHTSEITLHMKGRRS